MRRTVLLLAVTLLLQQLGFIHGQGGNTVMVNFLEVDYRDVEDKGAINVTLSVSGDFNNIDIKLTVTPYTFQQYQDKFMRPLHQDVINAAMNLDPAEYQVGGRQDFVNQQQNLTIPSTIGMTEDFSVSVPVTIDKINEQDEAFLIVVEVSPETTAMSEAPDIQLDNDGVTVGVIENDDIINFSFEMSEYSFLESVGTVNTVQVVKVNNTETEIEYTLRIVKGGGGTADEGVGMDFELDDMLELTFPPNVNRLPVPITIFDDVLPEITESVTLIIMDVGSNTSELLELAPISSTRVNILDNDVVVIGFRNQTLSFPEDATTAEVCVEILAPDVADLPDSFFILAAIRVVDGTATEGVDYKPQDIASMKDVFLDASDPQKCFNITILEDTVVDPNETFRVEVDISSFTEVATETRPATVTILDNDVPAPEPPSPSSSTPSPSLPSPTPVPPSPPSSSPSPSLPSPTPQPPSPPSSSPSASPSTSPSITTVTPTPTPTQCVPRVVQLEPEEEDTTKKTKKTKKSKKGKKKTKKRGKRHRSKSKRKSNRKTSHQTEDEVNMDDPCVIVVTPPPINCVPSIVRLEPVEMSHTHTTHRHTTHRTKKGKKKGKRKGRMVKRRTHTKRKSKKQQQINMDDPCLIVLPAEPPSDDTHTHRHTHTHHTHRHTHHTHTHHTHHTHTHRHT